MFRWGSMELVHGSDEKSPRIPRVASRPRWNLAFLRKRKAGGWYGRWNGEHGGPVERVMESRSKRKALAEALVAEAEARRRKRGDAPSFKPISIRQTYEFYAALAKRKRSWQAIEIRFRLHILPYLGDWDLKSITPADIDRLLTSKLEEGLAPQTVKHLRNHLSALFTFAIRKKKCFGGTNPVRDSDPIQVPEHPVTFIPREYVLRVIEQVPARRRNMFALAVYTGARAGELRGMNLASIDPARHAIAIWRSNDHDLTKGGKLRMVPVFTEALPFLQDQIALAQKKGSEWLFPAEDGGQIPETTKFSKLLRTAVVRAGLIQGYEHSCVTRGKRKGCGHITRTGMKDRIPCSKCGRSQTWCKAVPLRMSFKALRATFATHLYDATSDVRYVQKMLGHADVATTELYLGRMAARMAGEADRLSFAPRSVTDLPAGKPTNRETLETDPSLTIDSDEENDGTI